MGGRETVWGEGEWVCVELGRVSVGDSLYDGYNMLWRHDDVYMTMTMTMTCLLSGVSNC